MSEVADVVVVLSSLGALDQAIKWKRSGRISRLLAGPNLVEFPTDTPLLSSPEVDVCITPGPPTCDLYELDCPELRGRCESWPAGVDTDYWCREGEGQRTGRVLVYDKPSTNYAARIELYSQILQSRGYEIQVLRYGGYTPEEYRALLRVSDLMIGFSGVESQGVAWAEAWSTNVPTLLWKQERTEYNHPRSRDRTFASSTAPYLTPSTGAFFGSPVEFEAALERWDSGGVVFRPREWVLENMSDEAAARRLCQLAGLGIPL